MVAIADELQAGVPVAGAPELGGEFALGGAGLGLALLTAPIALGVVLEAPVLAWSDRADRRPVVAAALLAMALTSLAAAVATGPYALALALGLWGTACGVASGAAQAALVAGSDDPDRAMTRWGIGASIGDVVAPLLVGGVVAAGGSWRAAVVLAALVPLLDAVAVASGPPLVAPREDDDEPTTAREALADRWLLAWLFAAAACTLLDEVLVVFGSLRLEALGQPPGWRGAAIALESAGAIAGLAWSDRVLPRLGARRVLLTASAVTAASWLVWLAVEGPVATALALAVVGAAQGCLWPLCKAAAFARCPDRPGLVGALDTLFLPLDLAAPLVIGALADLAGLELALLALLVQPLVVGVVAFTSAPATTNQGAREASDGPAASASPRPEA